TLQLLAENAIKHNEVSAAYPLSIELFVDEQAHTLTMTNPIRLRQIPRESTGVGLSNIRARYQMISDREVEIDQQDGVFKVTLPLLSFQSGT
ncbi:MAG: histidine kinase, partial [Bacteroidia bacterium]|nr:histidine kinase [Bacteroidia bacterium]